MSTSFSFEYGPLPPVGFDDDRILTGDEMAVLKRLALGNGDLAEDYGVTNLLLSDFAGFMAGEITAADFTDDDDEPGDPITKADLIGQGKIAAGLVLALQTSAAMETWPDKVSPAGFFYGYIEKWFDNDRTMAKKVGGLPVREFLSQDYVNQRDNDG